ncbi:hypothetical protein [Reichenbachiella sp.]|uniref:hypothetical protein n=1 Tax=Reichenbachiella sp. TaxID=2184521 RepID=UPI003B5BCB3C
MKNLLTLLFTIAISVSVQAQTGNDYLELAREVLKAEKKAAIAEGMNLTEEESKVFWPLYNEYQAELYIIQNKRIDIVTDFAENYENLTDEKADELYSASIKYQKGVLKTETKYYKKFKKNIPKGKAARFFQLENKIETLIDAQMAMEIPLIEVSN